MEEENRVLKATKKLIYWLIFIGMIVFITLILVLLTK